MFATIGLLAAPLTAPLPQTNFDYVQLTGPGGVGLSQAFDINDNGVVAGSAFSGGIEVPALWSAAGGLQILSSFSTTAIATSVNDRGQVSGSFLATGTFSGSAERAFLWDGGTITTFDPIGSTEATAGVDISEDGRVLVGSGFFGGTSADRVLIGRTLLGTGAGLSPIVSFAAPISISANGTIAGNDEIVLGGQVLELGTLAVGERASASSVNDAGVAVGRLVRSGGGFSSTSEPAIWDATQQPTLLPVPNAFENSQGFDINNAGQIVGRADNQAFLIETDGTVVILANDTLGIPAGMSLREATDINERGEILGVADDGSFFNDDRFLLVPVDRIGEAFCVPGLNSADRTPTLHATGSASVASNDLRLVATDASDNFGLFFSSPAQIAPTPLGDGFLCLGGPIQRIFPAVSVQGGIGEVDLDLPALGITAGDTVSFQFWYRDIAPGGAGSNLTQGLEITFVQ